MIEKWFNLTPHKSPAAGAMQRRAFRRRSLRQHQARLALQRAGASDVRVQYKTLTSGVGHQDFIGTTEEGTPADRALRWLDRIQDQGGHAINVHLLPFPLAPSLQEAK